MGYIKTTRLDFRGGAAGKTVRSKPRQLPVSQSFLLLILIIPVLMLTISFDTAAEAINNRDNNKIYLKTGVLTPAQFDYESGLAFLERLKSESNENKQALMLVQLERIPNTSAKSNLASIGIKLLGYIPEMTWLARVDVSLSNEQLRQAGVRYLEPLGVERKISQRVLADDYAPWTSFGDQRRIYAIQMHQDIPAEKGRLLLEAWTDEIGDYIAPVNTFLTAIDPVLIRSLAREDEVRWICQQPPKLQATNNGAREAVDVDTLFAPPFNLSGAGVNVLVYDAGLVGDHPDFTGRLIRGETGNIVRHATHVAGTIAGDGFNSGGLLSGMAPGAEIISFAYEYCDPYCMYNSPHDLMENYASAIDDYNACFSNNSIGSHIAQNGYPCDWEGDYELTCQIVDLISTGDLGRPFLGIWSAGNERGDARCGTEYGTMSVPASAKNCIAVGATMSDSHEMTWFSGWGPVDDGRIKPDICAPGCQSDGDHGIASTVENGGYEAMCGASMATPVVSGVMALIYEQIQTTAGAAVHPLPATLKALVINTAFDAGRPGPDFSFGFGEIRAEAAVSTVSENNRIIEGMINHGDTTFYSLSVDPGTDELKLTLAWSDPMGEPLAAIELVNDIDIYLESPLGALVYPWILNPAIPDAPAGRGEDHLNPIEQIVVTDPEPGIWILRVTGATIPFGPQSYSLVANHPLIPCVSAVEEGHELSSERIQTGPCYPNPGLGTITVSYLISRPEQKIYLPIYDVSGRLVRELIDSPAVAGRYQVFWDGNDTSGDPAPAGIYFYRAVLPGESDEGGTIRRMVLMR